MQRLQITPDKKIHSGNETRAPLPAAVGQGGVSMMRFNTGISLSISDYRLNSATVMEYESFPRVIGFGFCLSGDISSHPAGFQRAEDIRSGQNALFHFDGDRMRETVGTKRVIRLNIMLEPERLQHLFENDQERISPVLRKITHRPRRVFGSLTPAMRNTVLQILDCPYRGLTREFFMESKALELVAYKLDQLGGESSRFQGRSGLKDEDLDRARYAVQLMVRDLEAPPGLPDLAREVGMCQSRLYQCFQEAYGMTPFDYLRTKRLETAERLLRRGELNVTQVACSVGYSSLSHFTKAFKQHTGILPSQCRGKSSLTRKDATG